jgi:hypothetical protein
MTRARLGIAYASALVLLLAGAPAWPQPGTPTDAKKSEEQAMAVVKRMAEFLSRLPRFSVTVDIGFDVVQELGQKIEFGETRKIVLRRPDHLRIDETRRTGAISGLVFDGKTLTVFNRKDNVYATDARVDGRGSVDEVIAHLIHDLDMRLPLAEWLDSNLPTMLVGQVRDAAYVERSQIAGVPCDHVALRGDLVDMQVWVAQGDQPLPRRLVMTYTREDGRPQFWAQFSDWNRAPAAPDSLFTFTPPAGAMKITFGPKMIQPGGIGGK